MRQRKKHTTSHNNKRKNCTKGVNCTNATIDVLFYLALKLGLYELLIISGENGIYKTAKMTTVLETALDKNN